MESDPFRPEMLTKLHEQRKQELQRKETLGQDLAYVAYHQWNFAINSYYHGNRASQPIKIQEFMNVTIESKVMVNHNCNGAGKVNDPNMYDQRITDSIVITVSFWIFYNFDNVTQIKVYSYFWF